MNTKRIFAAVAGALIAGLVLGNVASGFAANRPSTAGSAPSTVVAACNAMGLRLGSTMRASGGRLLDVVAKLTGTNTADVTAQRQAGKTFTQIAAAKGVSSSAVVAEVLKVREQVLAAKVKDGSITQAQADAALTAMKTQLAARLDSTNTNCGAGGGCGMGGGAGRGPGRGGAGCAGCAAVTQ
jgi:hypothetical protein